MPTRRINILLAFVLLYSFFHFVEPFTVRASPPHSASSTQHVYLPLIIQGSSIAVVPIIHAPFFSTNVITTETAIFWLGRVTSSETYSDVRVGYTPTELVVDATTLDRRLWYDTAPMPNTLTQWDAVSLYLNPNGTLYRFDAQLNWFEPRANYQAAFRNGSLASIPFTTETGWRGTAPNDNLDDKGWVVTFHIPFASLGLGTPADQSTWGMAVTTHNRDDASGTTLIDEAFPQNFSASIPSTWAQLSFGLPSYAPPSATPRATVMIRQGWKGATVKDGAVGGYTNCGGSLDYWTQWGATNYNGNTDFNIQNESDVSDYPCFSKYYATFPLASLPSGKVIISATLTLHQFGNSGAAGQATPSLIQVLTTSDGWDKPTIDWNNAPLPIENVSRAWVDPLLAFPGWPGIARSWDVSGAVAAAYSAGKSLAIVMYSADQDYHSGKYFVSSDTQDWNAEARPTLNVLWGDP